MKIYTFYTDTHKILYNSFLESIKNTNSDLLVVSEYFEQECNGNFMADGWNKTMHRKVDQIIKSCKENEIFIHSDCDVYFKRSIKSIIIEELGDFDIAFQDDSSSGYCMGFFICKPSKTIIDLFEDVRNNIESYGNDQLALNSLIYKYNIRHKKLSNRFFSYGQLNRGVWSNDDFEFPNETLLIHANWTIGVDNKLKLIEKLKNINE